MPEQQINDKHDQQNSADTDTAAITPSTIAKSAPKEEKQNDNNQDHVHVPSVGVPQSVLVWLPDIHHAVSDRADPVDRVIGLLGPGQRPQTDGRCLGFGRIGSSSRRQHPNGIEPRGLVDGLPTLNPDGRRLFGGSQMGDAICARGVVGSGLDRPRLRYCPRLDTAIGTEKPIPEEIDHREIAVRVAVMDKMELLLSPEPKKAAKP